MNGVQGRRVQPDIPVVAGGRDYHKSGGDSGLHQLLDVIHLFKRFGHVRDFNGFEHIVNLLAVRDV